MILPARRRRFCLSQSPKPGNRGFAALLGILLCVALPFAAADAQLATPAPTYVAPATLPPELLPAPPAEGSALWHEELATIVSTQGGGLSLDEMSAIRAEQRVKVELMTDLLGSRFDRSNLPKTFSLLNNVLTDASLITEADKRYWNTRRPFAADSRVKVLVDSPPDSPSYPSGHTSETRVLAEVLSLLVPQKRDELRARAEEIAQHRVDAGVHYSYDIEGGRMLAMLITGALMRSDSFRQGLAAAQEELAQSGFKIQ